MQLHEFLGLCQHVKQSGDKQEWTARCPSHDDKKNSLAIGTDGKKILLKCFAGCAFEQIIQALNVNPSDMYFDNKTFNIQVKSLVQQVPTIAELAAKKKLPIEWLKSIGVYQDDACKGIRIDYLDAKGQKTIRQRIRRGISAHDSCWDTYSPEEQKKPIGIYGLWREENQNATELMFCEGESNPWTLWFNEFPGYGIPGAEMYPKIEFAHVEKAKTIYILKDPDQGGEKMAIGIPKHLHKIGWHGNVYTISLPVKDVSDFYCQSPETFKERFSKILEEAERADIQMEENKVPEFPIDCLPVVFGNYAKNIAENMSCPLDYPAASLLSVSCIVAGGSNIYCQAKYWK